MVATATDNVKINQVNKIEQVINSDKFKNNLRGKIMPITFFNNKNVNLALEQELISELSAEIPLKAHYFLNILPDVLISRFIDGAKSLLQFFPQVITVELTPAKSIYFVAKIGKNTVYYDIFFDETTGNFATVAANVYENRVQKMALQGSFQFIDNALREILIEEQVKNYFAYKTYSL